MKRGVPTVAVPPRRATGETEPPISEARGMRIAARPGIAVLLQLVLYAGLALSPGAAAAGGEPPEPVPTPPPPPPAAPHPFTDIHSSAFHVEIAWLYNSEITGGCAATKFCPTGNVTREQMASFLVRALNLPVTSRDFFRDDEASSHEANINRLAAAEITGGCATGRFCPGAIVTREQMASFLVRALELPASSADRFSDDETSIHERDINSLAASRITGGCSATKYCPRATVKREQMAAFLFRGLSTRTSVTGLGVTGQVDAGGVVGGGGSIAGQNLPGWPFSLLACSSRQVFVGGPSVTASQGLIGAGPAYVWWISQLLYWDGANWQHYGWSSWYYAYVTNADTNLGSPVGIAGVPWTPYGGGPLVTTGLVWTVDPGFSWAAINNVEDNYGDTNAGLSLTDYSTGSYWCQS